MLKLVLHIVVAIGIWIAFGALGWPWPIRTACIVAGFVVVHLCWEKFVFQPYAYLGVMPVRSDDPLIGAAEKTAKDTLDMFLAELFPSHKEDSMIKVSYENADGESEKIWGDLLSVRGDDYEIYIRTCPVAPRDDFESKMVVSRTDVVDWSVEMRDGTLRGGFTNQALFKIFEREEGYMHSAFSKHIERFQDSIAPARTAAESDAD